MSENHLWRFGQSPRGVDMSALAESMFTETTRRQKDICGALKVRCVSSDAAGR